MRKPLGLGAILCALALHAPAVAAPTPNIWNDVAVCDPNFPKNCIAPTPSGAIPVTPSSGGGPLGATSTDASGTVTTGGTYQTLQAATATRKGCTIQNPLTATESLNVRVGANAAFFLAPGSVFNCQVGGIVVTDAIAVTAATTGHSFSANVQ